MPVPNRLKSCLDDHHVAYEIIHHPPHYTAQQIAADTHTPGREFAKTVFLKVDGKDAIAALPAHHLVVCEKLSQELAAWEVRLETEDEIRDVMETHHIEGELGAVPPFGNLYDLPVYASRALVEDERITFNAGTHEDVVRIRFEDFVELVHPHIANFSTLADAPQQRRADG